MEWIKIINDQLITFGTQKDKGAQIGSLSKDLNHKEKRLNDYMDELEVLLDKKEKGY